MSRYFNSFMDNSSEELEHSWGTSPKAKAREKEYNHWYYQKHKAEIAAIRKRRHAATNKYKQAEKSHNDAVRYQGLSDQMDARLHGWKTGPRTKTSENDGYYRNVTPIYEWGGLDQDGNSQDRYNGSKARHLTKSANSRLVNAKNKYERMSQESESKSNKLNYEGDREKYWAKVGAKNIHQHIKNPTAKDLAEFYLDTTVEKAKKSASKAANKAKKYATKAMFTAEKAAEKYATKATPTIEKAANKAKKYSTKAVSNAEKAANKAKKYATKTIKSVVR